MAAYVALSSLLLMAPLVLSSSTTPTNTSSTNHDLEIAIEEMKRANYFTFVMLINMALPNTIKPNITFLMPNDRTLAKTVFPENNVSDFLLRHSIPSPLLFDHLVHIPTGSMIPTTKPDLMLQISNNGRGSFYLSNVRLISPNLCTASYSIRCHGIDGVISSLASPTCSNNSSSTAEAPSPLAAPPGSGGILPSPMAVPPASGGIQTYPDSPILPHQQDDPKRSGSSHGSRLGRFVPVLLGLMIGLGLVIYAVFI